MVVFVGHLAKGLFVPGSIFLLDSVDGGDGDGRYLRLQRPVRIWTVPSFHAGGRPRAGGTGCPAKKY